VKFDRMVLGILLVGWGILALLMPAHSDTFWHLRAGADIWRTLHVPQIDSYSHTVAGHPWPDHEGLSQAGMYLCYRLGGMPGLELGAALLVSVAVLLAYRLMVGPLPTRLALMAVPLTVSSLLWVLRPQIVSLSLLLALVWLLARERHRWIPLLFLLWANAHAGVVLGGLVLAVAAGCAALRFLATRQARDRRRLLTLAVVLPLAALASAATPLGFGIYRFVLESTARLRAEHILEWGPPWPTGPFEVTFWLLALGFLGLLIWRRRQLAAAGWADQIVVASAAAVLALAFRSLRNIGPFLTVATPAASRLLGPDFRFRFRPRGRSSSPPVSSPDHPSVNLALLAGVAAAGLALVAFCWKGDAQRLQWHPIPSEAQRAVRGCPGRLYNHYYEGGYLIWFVPEQPVFIDNRQDPYPVSLLAEDMGIERGQPYRPIFERYGIRCAFLSASSKIVPRLRADGWELRFLDPTWAVLAAPGTGSGG
jgi:hypothetical protein